MWVMGAEWGMPARRWAFFVRQPQIRNCTTSSPSSSLIALPMLARGRRSSIVIRCMPVESHGVLMRGDGNETTRSEIVAGLEVRGVHSKMVGDGLR